MNPSVYILSCSNGKYYIGSTNHLKRRIAEHQKGYVKSTQHVLPVNLVFYQEYEDLKTARWIEYRLKKFKNRKIIDNIVADGFIKTV